MYRLQFTVRPGEKVRVDVKFYGAQEKTVAIYHEDNRIEWYKNSNQSPMGGDWYSFSNQPAPHKEVFGMYMMTNRREENVGGIPSRPIFHGLEGWYSCAVDGIKTSIDRGPRRTAITILGCEDRDYENGNYRDIIIIMEWTNFDVSRPSTEGLIYFDDGPAVSGLG